MNEPSAPLEGAAENRKNSRAEEPFRKTSQRGVGFTPFRPSWKAGVKGKNKGNKKGKEINYILPSDAKRRKEGVTALLRG